MKYPEEFVARVNREYFSCPRLSEMLRSALSLRDSAKVEECLNIGRGLGYNFSPEKIIEYLDAGNLEQIRLIMKRCIEREKLYFEDRSFRLSEKPANGKEASV